MMSRSVPVLRVQDSRRHRSTPRVNVGIDAVAAELERPRHGSPSLTWRSGHSGSQHSSFGRRSTTWNGILDHAPLATRVAWVRDLFERIDVDSRDEKAVAVWRAATDEGVNRSDSVYEWLRR
jgi:hypothetical protein